MQHQQASPVSAKPSDLSPVPNGLHLPSRESQSSLDARPQEGGAPAASHDNWNHVTNAQQTNVQVNVGMPSIQFNAAKQGHSLFVRALWFLAIGWWLSGLFIAIGYILVASVFLLPLGLWFLNRIPQAQTLRARTRAFTTEFRDNAIVFTEGNRKQVAWYLRLLYLPVGLILGVIWLTLSWLVSLTIIGLPVSIMMVDRAPAVITLQRH